MSGKNSFRDVYKRQPKIPVEDYIQAVETLVDVDRDWVPHSDGASLYIRPFVFANDVGPVSYTHLDVYKRQACSTLHRQRVQLRYPRLAGRHHRGHHRFSGRQHP